ncbi:MAG: ADP-ribosyl-[dinitrogen reductase] glycohydrolase [Candidatus Dichloromethanomonas elyunquensis]|nr:MAG: ADP-ribosyl-[dinitrogen reductase] glycohydrolase [Candidatus Dichloromethanomonas elyunquensis]
MTIWSKIAGSLLGVAVGDALGATVEFMTRGEISRQFGIHTEMIGEGYWQLAPGEVTDDTDMTMAVAKGILMDPGNPVRHIARFFADWAATDPKDIGNICRRVLTEGIRRGTDSEAEWLEVAELAHLQSGGRSGGNGSLMRTIPIVLAYYTNRDTMLHMALRQSRLTHYDPAAGECVVLYCDLVGRIINGKSLKPAVQETVREGSEDVPFKCNLLTEQIQTTGYAVHTLEAAINCAYQTDSFEEALTMAVNLGGDADTIGAVTGGIAGAYYGLEQIPSRWLEKLAVKKELLDLAERIYRLNNK